jgi:hypothetical protein
LWVILNVCNYSVVCYFEGKRGGTKRVKEGLICHEGLTRTEVGCSLNRGNVDMAGSLEGKNAFGAQDSRATKVK